MHTGIPTANHRKKVIEIWTGARIPGVGMFRFLTTPDRFVEENLAGGIVGKCFDEMVKAKKLIYIGMAADEGQIPVAHALQETPPNGMLRLVVEYRQHKRAGERIKSRSGGDGTAGRPYVVLEPLFKIRAVSRRENTAPFSPLDAATFSPAEWWTAPWNKLVRTHWKSSAGEPSARRDGPIFVFALGFPLDSSNKRQDSARAAGATGNLGTANHDGRTLGRAFAQVSKVF